MANLVWRVKLVTELEAGETTEVEVARLERDEQAGLADLGLRLAEAKQLMAMKTAMVLALAARILVSFGMGTAMAQSEVPRAPEAAFYSGHHLIAPRIINGGAGSSDANTQRRTVHFDHATLASPG